LTIDDLAADEDEHGGGGRSLTFVWNCRLILLLALGDSSAVAKAPELAVTRDDVLAALVRRLSAYDALQTEDVEAICALPIAVKDYSAQQTIVHDGERPTECCLIAEGFCMRSKTTSNGHRQILSIHIPGEVPDLQSLFLEVMDHDLTTLTPCTLGFISHATLRDLHRRRPRVAEMFWRDSLLDAAIFREWILNVGQRTAPSRLAHVVVELQERLKMIGRGGRSFELPLTQEQIADALGITAVHANRVVKQLREDGIIEFQRGRVNVLDEFKLRELADFDGRYLHRSSHT
jgi:CRP-like cAMP-binding protein